MRSILLALLLFLGANLSFAENIKGLYCGTRGTLLGTIASDFVIPDYFPPENSLLRAIFLNPFLSNLNLCENEFKAVNLGIACFAHDQCYARIGANKDSCDINLLEQWKKACSQSYDTSSGNSNAYYCLQNCELAADIMYNSMRYQLGDFCPSCRAFEKSQKKAQNNMRS